MEVEGLVEAEAIAGCLKDFAVGFAVDFAVGLVGLGALEDFEGPKDCAI